MEKLFTLLTENPRAVLESGVPIPCTFLSLLEVEDDENFMRVCGQPLDNLHTA